MYISFVKLSLAMSAFLLIQNVSGRKEIRKKRQISHDLPRIVTTDGHLIFMTGANHNITFKSSAGGSVNIDDHDISQMMVSQQKSSQELKTDVDRMKRDQQTFKAKVYNNITQKLNGMIENYGRLKRSLETLNQTLSGSGNNLVTRIVSLERKAKFDPQVLQATVDRLSSQVSSLLSPSTESPRARRELRRLGQRVTQLEVSLREVKTNLEKENCESSPCLHGGTCYNRYNGYYCSCTPGWMGLRCSEDVNECSEFVGTTFGCQNGGTCLNTYGSYRCQCTANWHGVHCNSRHDDCSGSSTAELCGHGTCINVVRQQPNQPNYKCICDPGWTTSSNGPSCTEDIDECSSRGSPCFKHSQVTCYNTPGSFHCSACPAGFTGNGFSCMDINECEVNNGGCSRVPLVDCINTYGSRTCGPCPGDYSGDGTVCRYVGLCHRNNGGCHPLATCTENTNVPDQRVCVCTAGYSGSGIGPNGCTRHDPCENNECAQGSTCSVTSPTSYTCVCQPGHYGEHCYQIEDGCSPNPCMNGGTCILEGNLRYNCVCNSSFTGEQCQTAVSDCGGTLTGTHGSIIYPSVAGTHYPNDINCEWLIDVAFGKVVNINFTSIDMECGFDYVDVHDGIDRFANSLGRFCNLASLPEDPLTSSTNKIFLKFRSDSAVTNTGFRLNWTAQQPECGKVISGKTHGTIKSPGYPGNYAHRLDCVWTISAQPDQDITVQFADFSLEHSSTCRYDYLQFRNGITSDAPSLGKFCGRRLPQHVRSTEPYMYIKFVTDFSGTDKGFLLTFATTRDRHGCGGRRPEREGVIASANFPNSYGSNGDCVWIIQPQHTVIFTFDSMDLPGERPCLTDYVEIRDGSSPTSPLIGHYCGQSKPSTIISNQNSIWVHFKANVSTTHSGFRARWKVACGGTYTKPSGLLQSPFLEQGSDNDTNEMCIYVIRQQPSVLISVMFDVYSFYDPSANSTNCSSNYIEIRQGTSKTSPLLGKYCDYMNLPPAVTAQRHMRIEFRGGPGSLGFNATYSTNDAGCGGILTGPLGTIASPLEGKSYPNGITCTWNIIVGPLKIISLIFTQFQLESQSSCKHDFVKIIDKANVSNEITYCGHNIPPAYTSYSNQLKLTFKADSSIAYAGFRAIYSVINNTNVCGGTLTASSGMIISPDYPKPLSSPIKCVWEINVQENTQIQLNVTDFGLFASRRCGDSYLEIRHGSYEFSPLAGRYCGDSIPPLILSHHNHLRITLMNKFSTQRKGFKILYDSLTRGCGGELYAQAATIESPHYPQPYYHRAECIWHIKVAQGSHIRLFFFDFQIENSCSFDYLEIRDPNQYGVSLGKFCGDKRPPTITSLSNQLFIKFKTDLSVSYRGFKLSYESKCNSMDLNDINGIIESPGFPQKYSNNINCTWIIRSLYENTIYLVFSHFEIESGMNCRYDYLEIRDGDQASSPLIGKFCGSIVPSKIYSSNSSLRISFHTDHSISQPGFRLEYFQRGCVRHLTEPYEELDYSSYYYNHCIWIITVNSWKKIQLNITKTQLGGSQQCDSSFLKVYDGNNLKSPLLTKLCDNPQKPIYLTSTGNKMTVVYFKYSEDTAPNFDVSYEEIEGGCGGNLHVQNGTINSPNYPQNYPHNSNCDWLITPKKGYFIKINFKDFNINGNCSSNYLTMSERNTPSDQYCGSSLKGHSMMFNSEVLITMRTDDVSSGSGFKLKYSEECGSSFDASVGGFIQSSELLSSKSCRWLLQANTTDEHVTLHFTKFSAHINCSKEYVKVLDGIDAEAPVIGTYCGQRLPPRITSLGSALYIIIQKDDKLLFHATYSTSISSCGGKYEASSGSFNSPMYPENYPMDTTCVWQLLNTPGSQVQVAFSVFNLENHAFCNKDYLESRHSNSSGALIGRYCGTTPPSNVASDNGLWVKFRSDENTSGRGFMAHFSSQFGGDLTGDSGSIIIPAWNTPHGIVEWTITVTDGLVLFISLLRMKFIIFESECVGYLEIHESGTVNGPLLGKYCRDEKVNIVSTTNQVYLKYVPFGGQIQEFSLNWTAVTNGTQPDMISGNVRRRSHCYHRLLALDEPKVITSPGYPNGYSPSLYCTWNIMTQPGYKISANITDIDMEVNCFKDYLLYTYSYRHICKMSQINKPLLSTSNQARLRFRSDRSDSGRGFTLEYKRVCGGRFNIRKRLVLTSSTGSDMKDCEWKFVARYSQRLTLSFIDGYFFSRTENCSKNYIQILDGYYRSSPPLGNGTDGKYCGYTRPETMVSFGRNIFVNISAENNPTFTMVVDIHQRDCGGHRYVDSTTEDYITSPHYPNQSPRYTECEWIINAPPLKRIQVDFIGNNSISRGSSSSCLYFHDGGTGHSPRIAKICGQAVASSTIFSLGNIMYVRYRVHYRPDSRFKFKYSIAKCGGTLNEKRGQIKSDNYPEPYQNNMNCEWAIRVLTGQTVSMNFQTFSLQSSPNCTADYVYIFEKSPEERTLFRSCGQSATEEIKSTSNEVFIVFKTDKTIRDQGFVLNYHLSEHICGGSLTQPLATITSPYYPQPVHDIMTCTWDIKVKPDRRVKLTLNDMDLQYCWTTYLNAYQTFSNEFRMKKFCRNVPITEIQSSQNTMRVTFVSGSRDYVSKFSASYTSEENRLCGGLLTDDSGSAVSPTSDPGNNPENVVCSWLVQPSLRANMSIVVDVNNSNSTNCLTQYLEIIDGNDESGDVIDRVCQNNSTRRVATSSHNLFIRFVATPLDPRWRIAFNYSVSECGGILSDEIGTITSPNYPNSYPNNIYCVWKIIGDEGRKINLTFVTIDVESSENCSKDYIDVLNGKHPGSLSMGKHCGQIPALSFRTETNSAIIIFKSDSLTNRRGFLLRYQAEDEGCGGILNKFHGEIMSPKYPQSYPANKECTWDIKVPLGYRINLKFDSPFDLEYSHHCTNDYIQVQVPSLSDTPKNSTRYCSNIVPVDLSYLSSALTIVFRSNSDISGNGFLARWTAECGSIYSADSGAITSPGFPNRYYNDLQCSYFITGSNTTYTVLRFNTFRLHDDCNADYLLIAAGNEVRRKYCGNYIPQKLTLKTPVNITFKTDSSITANGFEVTFTKFDCGGILTDPTGEIESVNFDHNLFNEVVCTWHINVQENRSIEMKIEDFELRTSYKCGYAYVEIYDGNRQLGRFCGPRDPWTIKSRSNTMSVKFRLGYYYRSRNKFRATYTTTFGVDQGCGGLIRNKSGSISSTNIIDPTRYENNLNCEWIITGGSNEYIELAFESFDVEPSERCTADYVKISDHIETNSYCGSTIPRNISSSANSLHLWFRTNGSGQRSGFKLHYTIKTIICTGRYNAITDSKNLTSPSVSSQRTGQQNMFLTFTTCHWTLTAPTDKNIRIQFLLLNMTENCLEEYFTVKYSSVDLMPYYVGCGHQLPPVLYSLGNTVEINYRTKSLFTKPKLALTYKVADCNRHYTNDHGEIFSPAWPQKYPRNSHCYINIHTSNGTKISLFFYAFQFEHHRSCNYDYLQISYQYNISSNYSINYCSNYLPNPIFTEGNTVSMLFKTDRSINKGGFHLIYTSTTQESGCGGNLTGVNGTFASPNYGRRTNFSMSSSECVWRITVPLGRRLKMEFSEFGLDEWTQSLDCTANYISVYNGGRSTENLVGTYCGQDKPDNIMSQSNVMSVTLNADGISRAPRFIIRYMSQVH